MREMFLFLMVSLITAAHPVHVTLMSVEYSDKSDSFNVFLKVYTDDFLLDYRTFSGDTSKVVLASDNNEVRKIVDRYIKDKVQIFAEGKLLTSRIAGLDFSEGELKMDLVYNNIRKSKSYLVRNMILTDIYKDQSNLLIFRFGNNEEGIKLTADMREQEFKIK
jgi:hypothetical protein